MAAPASTSAKALGRARSINSVKGAEPFLSLPPRRMLALLSSSSSRSRSSTLTDFGGSRR